MPEYDYIIYEYTCINNFKIRYTVPMLKAIDIYLSSLMVNYTDIEKCKVYVYVDA